MKKMIKTCGCGLRYSRAAWAALPLLGTQFVPEDETGPAEALELRNCPCGSTISLSLDPRDPTDPEFIVDGVLVDFLGDEVRHG